MGRQSPQTWARDTKWRQGHVLDARAVSALALKHSTAPLEETCVVVISHDCDVANDDLNVEPEVEVIVGRLIDKANGNFAFGKAPRTLHLDILRDGAPKVIELIATQKHRVSKDVLAAFDHDVSFSLEPKALSVLRNWLAIRYQRAAFPDNFVKRMNETKVAGRLEKILENYGSVISTVFFAVDDGREIDRLDGSPYELSIVLVYVPGQDPDAAADFADKAAEKVEELFSQKLFDKKESRWDHIGLKGCRAISEDDIPVSRAKVMTQWRLEHMSLRTDDEQARPWGLE